MDGTLTIKRTHGLGNVLLLLPVLELLRDRGESVRLLTRLEWVGAVAALVPGVKVQLLEGPLPAGAVDLDVMTLSIKPVEHRTLELARLLGIDGDIPARRYTVPEAWGRPFDSLAGCVILAPEAGHPARQWAWKYVRELAASLTGSPLVLTGTAPSREVVCDRDLRGELDLAGMLGLLSRASAVVTLDSGTLHMATSLGVPSVAVFGGVNPRFRVRESQRAVVLQADMACAPCDKNETCDGRVPCLQRLRPEHVLDALRALDGCRGLEIRRI
ncbi:glycosyltransferase family 9 protein [Pseudodesulfovibrio methanolicus]|uniref:Glycosyltransferase family 9 protein n=1 Tax=Pseudodesulfovibrio methanolicus TaxID=3126690 RepID=A0ABZ2J117_9BACT